MDTSGVGAKGEPQVGPNRACPVCGHDMGPGVDDTLDQSAGPPLPAWFWACYTCSAEITVKRVKEHLERDNV